MILFYLLEYLFWFNVTQWNKFSFHCSPKSAVELPILFLFSEYCTVWPSWQICGPTWASKKEKNTKSTKIQKSKMMTLRSWMKKMGLVRRPLEMVCKDDFFFQFVKLVHICSDKSKIVQFIRNWSNFILKYDFFGWSCFVKQIFIPFWYLGFWLFLAMKLRNYYSLSTFFTAQGKTGKTEI